MDIETLDTALQAGIYTPEALKECEKRSEIIRSELKNIEKSYVKIAFHLYWIYSTKIYRAYACESITDYAASAFGFSKSTTYNYISLVERFGKRNKEGVLEPGVNSLEKEYKDFSYSQLLPLVELSDEEIGQAIVPSMSVRDIKKMVKAVEKSRDSSGTLPDDSGSAACPEPDGTEPDGQEVLVADGNELVLPDSGLDTVTLQSNKSDEDDFGFLNIDYVLEMYVDGVLIRSDTWSIINDKFIYDSLKYNPDTVLVFRSLKSKERKD